MLFRCLREHPLISGFSGTGVPEDEGQHLQDVFSAAREHGGPGKFGFDPRAHLTETSGLVTDENRQRLFSQWSRHWNLDRPVLLEKSPPNLIRTRFLQALFPESYFVILMRNPIAVAYATQKWSRTSIPDLLEHWLVCHETFESDRQYIKRVLVLRYEEFVNEPQKALGRVWSFLGIESAPNRIRISDSNPGYLDQWRSDMTADGVQASNLLRQHLSPRFSRFGYDLGDSRLALGQAPIAGVTQGPEDVD